MNRNCVILRLFGRRIVRSNRARFAAISEHDLAPSDGGAQRAFGAGVRGPYAFVMHERRRTSGSSHEWLRGLGELAMHRGSEEEQ
jgi:hypothetical protein